MRFKWVPEPPASLEELRSVQRAIPLVPASKSDCLARLGERTTQIDDRETANEWLTFLRALEAVEQVSGGYRRTREELTAETLASRLQERLFGGRELYASLVAADEPLDVESLLECGIDLPTWERHHHTDHQRVHRRRQRRLADWFVLCAVAEKTATGYRLTESERPDATTG